MFKDNNKDTISYFTPFSNVNFEHITVCWNGPYYTSVHQPISCHWSLSITLENIKKSGSREKPVARHGLIHC